MVKTMNMIRVAAFAALAIGAGNGFAEEADVIVYGASPAGYAAAIQAKRMGRSVIVLEPSGHVGGLTTGGLGQTDIGNKEAFGGIAREFYRDIKSHYLKPGSWTREKMSDYLPEGQCANSHGNDTMWTFEPSAAKAVLADWEKRNGLTIVRNAKLDRTMGKVKVEEVEVGGRGRQRKIVSFLTEDGTEYRGKMFIDATYEGDLMAAAGVTYTVGRESNETYGETLNGMQPVGHPHHNFDVPVDPYVVKGDPKSGLLPGIESEPMGKPGEGDRRVQAYCFRMTLTDDPANRIPFAKPEGYDERNYELMFRNYEAGEATNGLPWINSRMPNRKTDTNNRRGFSTDFIGQNHAWPDASYAERERILKAHLDYQKGLMWSLAYHPRVPQAIRDIVSKWGLCKDEFVENGGWTPQLYVREARRLVGEYVMTEKDCVKTAVAPRPVALAAYQMDSHNVRRYVTAEGRVRNEGDVEVGCTKGPFGIDYGAIVPKRGECANLFVPVCLSASHIAFGSIRMEPVFFALGQAAGTAACVALDDGVAVQDVEYSTLRDRLLKDGQRIEPKVYPYTVTPRPKDFDAYWENAIAALDRDVPEDAKCELDPSLETASFTCYRVSFATYGKGRRVYGFLSVPKTGKAPYPVRITVPGAGRGTFTPFKQTGCIGLVMNVHDYAPKANQKEQEAAYQEENARWGAPYGVKWYFHSGIQKSREDYFYYGAILGINRAVNWLARRDDVDLKDFTYRGQSQGGAFGIYLAALNKHITAATISEPAITDTLAYKAGRKSGWPTITEVQPDKSPANIAAIEERMRYFDTVNFVPRITCPTRWLAGWVDQLCPAECVHAGYNRLNPTNDRRIVDGADLGHGIPSDVYRRYENLLTASWEPIPTVLVGDDPADKLAADEFVKYYEKMSGIAPSVTAQGLGIGDRGLGGKGPVVKIGRSFAAGLEFDKKFDSYRIKSEKKDGHWNLLLAGGNARSTMYAVYEFFKSQGCRWFWDGDVVPKTGVVDLSGQDVYEVSQFEWRATRYFAHRGLRRFSAEMWGPEDWKREIDWCLKNRLNLFFFRLGMDDLFQKAFPEYCKYPDASKPIPGQGEGYDNRQLFWSLEYRGRLRKEFTDYAFARGLMIPPDFGTITHWYTRTPEDFLKGAQPEFLPEPARGYAAVDSGKVWDVRQDKWMDAYWKLTEAEIANYGRTPGPLHTIGFSERNLFDNRADNLKMKVETTKRMFDRALKSYPDATILFAGWDFYSTWTPDELKDYWPTLDPKHVVIFDYEANAYRPEHFNGVNSNFTKWGLIGKFPYVFGTFFYESGTPIHTDYDLILKRRKFVEGDPMCKGTILWPEASHVDILEQRFFTDNAWKFTDETVDGLIDGFCTDRYGRQAKALAEIWRKVVPMSVKCAGSAGPWRANYADKILTHLAGDYGLNEEPECHHKKYGWDAFKDAPQVFAELAKLDWRDDFVRRDTIDLARTVADRLMLEAICDTQWGWYGWQAKKSGDTAKSVLHEADLILKLADLLGRVLSLHSDFSLWETYKATDAIERIKLAGFDRVLLENAVNSYCLSHQAEPAVHLYPKMLAAWRDELAAKLAAGDRKAHLKGEGVKALFKPFWKNDLRAVRPTLPRTEENYRKTMRELENLAKELLKQRAPSGPVPDPAAAVNIVVKKGEPLVLEETLKLGSNSSIVLEEGAEIIAAKGKFLGKSEPLILIAGANNVKICGKGTLRMNKDDYYKAPYQPSEHRHCIAIRGSSDVLIEDVTCRDAGGDGVYVSTLRRGVTNHRVTLRRVRCDNNHRQGVSVISCEKLLIEDCDLVNTSGGAPEAGIDFEPNYPEDLLVRCVVRNTRLTGNHGAGVDVSFHNLDETTEPVDILFENCRMENNHHSSVVIARNKFNGAPKGKVLFNDCTMIGGKVRGVELLRKVGDGFRVEFNRCRIENACPDGAADVTFVSRDWSDNPPDNIAFNDLVIVQAKARPWFQNVAPGVGPAAVTNLTGTVTVRSPKGEEKIVLDTAWMKANFRDPPPQPPARWTGGRARTPAAPQDVVVFDSCPDRMVKLEPFAQCGEARMVFYADRAKTVHFVGQRYWWPGKKRENETRPIRVESMDGKFACDIPIVPFEPTAFSVDVPKAGLYHLHVFCYRNKFILNESDVPVAIWPRKGPQRIFCLEPDRHLYLRPRAGKLAFLASCKDESVEYAVTDGAGREIWTAAPHDWTCWTTEASADAGLWTFTLGCPNSSALPTGYSTIFDVTGTPGFVFLSKEKTWEL